MSRRDAKIKQLLLDVSQGVWDIHKEISEDQKLLSFWAKDNVTRESVPIKEDTTIGSFFNYLGYFKFKVIEKKQTMYNEQTVFHLLKCVSIECHSFLVKKALRIKVNLKKENL